MSDTYRSSIGSAAWRKVALVVTTILLVVHWAAPNFQAFGLAPSFESPIYSSKELGAYPGTLPRLSSRAQSVQAGVPKSDGAVEPPTQKPKAIQAFSLVVVPYGQTVAGQVLLWLPPSETRRDAFQARAPPPQG